MRALERACAELRAGRIVLVFDREDREGETDMVASAPLVTAEHVRTMRREAGGLVCMALGPEESESLGIPFMTDVLGAASSRFPMLSGLYPNDIPYDERSSFSITVNHRRTFTGVTDRDRALTIRELARLVAERRWGELGALFRSPGHVPLLRGADDLLGARRGHTELTLALADLAGLPRATAICEMMADSGSALPPAEARSYARAHGLAFVAGDDVAKAWEGARPCSR